MNNVTDIVKSLPDFEEPIVTDPKEIIKGEFHEKDGKWFHSTGRFAGDSAEHVIQKYKLTNRIIKPYAYYVVSKVEQERLARLNLLTSQYQNVFLIGLYLGGTTEAEVLDELKQYTV